MDDGFVIPVNPTRPPPIHWGEVTVIKPKDPRRGKVGSVSLRDSVKRDGQWNYHVRFQDEPDTVQYLHDELFMGRP